MVNGAWPRPCAWPSMMRLVEVPVSVQVPPRMQANESGMSRREALSSELLARRSTMGRKTTTTGVLLTKAESTAPVSMRTASTRSSPSPARRRNQRPMMSMQPERSSPALRMNMQAMVIGAGLLKAPSISSFERMPVASTSPSENTATMSGGSHSRKKASPARPRRTNTKIRWKIGSWKKSNRASIGQTVAVARHG